MNEEKFTLNKIKRDSIKFGLREGTSDGRDSVFQRDFDRGYQDGFRHGFEIGKFIGSLKYESKEIDELLKQPDKAWCQICEKKLENKTIDELVNIQNQLSTSNFEKLFLKYNKNK